MDAAMAEMEMVMYSVVEDALKASDLGPSEVWDLSQKHFLSFVRYLCIQADCNR